MDLERVRDALLESYTEITPEALDALTLEERRQVYGMLRLRIEVAADGTIEARGILGECVHVQRENGRLVSEEVLCENGLASRYNSQNTKTLGVRFSALLTEGGAERLELARA
ncbi:MAG TPA: hypothetical protein VE691_17490 [Rubrobacter sp.]|nr:hypothetical protein [Rubrobacter sp.]